MSSLCTAVEPKSISCRSQQYKST